MALCVALTATAYVYLRYQLGKINTVDIPSLTEDSAGGVMNVLLVGSDTRSTATGDIAEATGKEVEGERQGLSDTMMILHADARQGQAAILSIPRDLYVTISGTGERDRINSAFAVGGAHELIQTVQDNLGVSINHYVEVDFEGFSRIVDTVGGLNIYFDAPARDENTGLDIPEAGCVRLDGYQALAYVRSRYYESYEAGQWHYDEASDFGRIERQQDLIRRMMRKAVSSGLSNPLMLNRLINIGVDNLTIDSSMSTKDIVNVARRFRSLDPDVVDMQTLPTSGYTTPGGAAVQLLNEEEAQPLLDRINGKSQPGPVRPSDVQVRVLNGYGGDGAAGKAAFSLRNVGFAVTGSGDADTFTYDETVIRHGPGALPKAQLLQSYLAAGATLEEDSSLGTADVALVLGADYTGVRPSPAGPDASPKTTAAPGGETPDAKGSNQPPC
ncbi:MAG: LCP family protein [Actinomycetota bacterium]|nr:LCP family protein [Actinomycetota bacterium]